MHTYRFTWRPSGSPMGATHCLELPLLFGTRRSWMPCPMLGNASWSLVQTLGYELRHIWGYFARTGLVHCEGVREIPLEWNRRSKTFDDANGKHRNTTDGFEG
ncbi:carboxylesterase [Mycobacteroides abscessus subsp. bolletii]|nr:carboxylesterase [Mycobacteroides abscessus subsp. bolletii]SKP68036.1 carboxylesterase [Mycobacteroides abscessus subsp. bolletii]SKP69204.1 carboxylesterase [Mycobacteroides abscessus subsp. bolletii]SKQ27798.1 carboxylesterase [Mycobacteroides abscessus subsp. bolletii]